MSSHSRPIRRIARLDVKGPNLIKGVHLEGLRVIGDPQEFASRYYEQGADELIYIDIVASLYGRSNLVEIVRRTAHDVFVPLMIRHPTSPLTLQNGRSDSPRQAAHRGRPAALRSTPQRERAPGISAKLSRSVSRRALSGCLADAMPAAVP